MTIRPNAESVLEYELCEEGFYLDKDCRLLEKLSHHQILVMGDDANKKVTYSEVNTELYRKTRNLRADPEPENPHP